MFSRFFGGMVLLTIAMAFSTQAQEPAPPTFNESSQTNRQPTFKWSPFPAADQYRVWMTPLIDQPFQLFTNGVFYGNSWTLPGAANEAFFKVEANPMPENELLTTTVLNRLSYGPTPDELDRVRSIGPDAFIEEQLAPELIPDYLDSPSGDVSNAWFYVTATGPGSSSILYLFLSDEGSVLIDDIKLVHGSLPGVGPNLLRNGDFELPIAPDWQYPSNYVNSTLSSNAHSGNTSLQLISLGEGTGRDNSVFQVITPSLRSSSNYTLSFWYHPGTNTSALTVRLSGSGIVANPDGSLPRIYQRLTGGIGSMADLRAWYVMRAVRTKRQLWEILTQFLENHFVTQYDKSQDYFDGFYSGDTIPSRLATLAEFNEISRWRQALLNPNCTFHDLLLMSAESPAMIIYLDTVNSRGSNRRIANENYARELLELFTFGVDNGYDQNDIIEISKTWTGWSVGLVDYTNVYNPFAIPLKTQFPDVAYSNLFGAWAFIYKPQNHNTNSKTIFPGKTVPARFGSPWAGRNYQLTLPSRNGTNGIQDGYDVIAHLANQPFTQEYLSVKLCQWFVHDDFHTGYDFTDPGLSEEGKLVLACMQSWESSGGKIRPLLRVIFNSALFRGHTGSLQKVKTPLEYTISAIRALRSVRLNGTATAETTGFGISGNSASSSGAPLNRMGGMLLFDRSDPDGYPEAGAGWISAGTLAERLRWIQSFLTKGNPDGNVSDPADLLFRKLPENQWRNAPAVAGYFVNLIYPGEGRANLEQYISNAVDFLNSDNAGVKNASTAFSLLNPDGNQQELDAYDLRVRGMVAMLLTLQRFQEQ
jgi:uncharacterized protein (DUF1800 family)